MASLHRKTTTRPLPEGAELFAKGGEQFARWKLKGGKLRTARVVTTKTGELRIRTEAATWTACYRDGNGIRREVSTGCRDKTAALSVLKELLARAERVRGNLVSAADDAVIDYQDTPLADVLADYLAHLRGKGCAATYATDTERAAKRAFAECKFRTLRDFDGERLERWLAKLVDGGLSPRSRNAYLQAVRSFCRWCVQSGRLTTDPTRRIGKLNEAVDTRKTRRALTPAELTKLLYAAEWRPLAEFGRETVSGENRKGRGGWTYAALTFDTIPTAVERAKAKLSPDRIAELHQLGRQRALAYKTLVLTGLRRGELASLTVASLNLNCDSPYLVLAAGAAKNRTQAEIPLRGDLASDLASWVAELRQAFLAGSGAVISFDAAKRDSLPSNTPLFPNVHREFVHTFDRDLKAAGIEKSDDRGRTVDVHALRHTYGSLLSAGGVSPRTAQAAMRHSSVDLTMNVYTDPRVLDVAGALDALPSLPLGAEPVERQRNVATGTDNAAPMGDSPQNLVATTVATDSDKRSKLLATGDNWARDADCTKERSDAAKQAVSGELESAPCWNRTNNLLIKSQFLERLHYWSMASIKDYS